MKFITQALIIFSILGFSLASFGQHKNNDYSFFTAGHAYGNPNSPRLGLYPVLMDVIPTLNIDPKMELAFLTGDFVVSPTDEYYGAAEIDLNEFSMPYYIAAGNHDISSEFEERFNPYYFAFQHREDLFIILTPGLNQWNIEGDQLAFLEQTLEDYASESRHIFIMLHELIWWSPTNIFQDVKINWVPLYPGSTNYDDVLKPLLLTYPNQIFLFAGDIGCTSSVSPCMYYENENITLIASGLGSGNNDNIIIVNIIDDVVELDLYALNGEDPDAMGELSDWAVNVDLSKIDNDTPEFYPNPSSNYINIKTDENIENISILSSSGALIKKYTNTTNRIEISAIKNGIYILEISLKDIKHHQKLIINRN